jgi:hypothetical protein
MIEVFTSENLSLWTGDADELADASLGLPEWQLDMVRALTDLPVGCSACVGTEQTFHVVRV